MRALISVFNKSGVGRLGAGFDNLGIKVISTGGTAEEIRGAGVVVIDVSRVTGFPEMLGGRVKTLHPAIHAGIMAEDNPEHNAELAKYCIKKIQFVVVNFYPPSKMIDIGGPTLARAAGKSWEHGVTVLVDPADYDAVLEELYRSGSVSRETRLRLARKAFATTRAYDEDVEKYMATLA